MKAIHPEDRQANIAEAPMRARRFLALLVLILSVVIFVSLYFDLHGLEDRYRDLAAEMGRSFYRAIDTMREWNLDHGGLYVRSSGDVPPNPYLAAGLREVTLTRGENLTLITHAHMTRLLSELLSHQRGVRLHIASRTPIRPDNSPDAWEKNALARFEEGRSQEEYGIVRSEGDGLFRYMAPLRTRTGCLSCHSTPENGTAAIRGGISVSFTYAPFSRAAAAERNQMLMAHGMFFAIGLGLILLTGRRLMQIIEALKESLLHIKRLEGLLPICAQCKKVRLEGADRSRADSWVEIERYIEDHTDAEFTHGICPRCAHELYPTVFSAQTH